jgi:hypothetical protein
MRRISAEDAVAADCVTAVDADILKLPDADDAATDCVTAHAFPDVPATVGFLSRMSF